jgi:hypothetical protein
LKVTYAFVVCGYFPRWLLPQLLPLFEHAAHRSTNLERGPTVGGTVHAPVQLLSKCNALDDAQPLMQGCIKLPLTQGCKPTA